MRAGKIGAAHGIKGWVRVTTFTDQPEDLLALGDCYIGSGLGGDAGDREEKTPVHIAEGRSQGKSLLMRLEGVTDRNKAEGLRGKSLWVPAQQLPELAPGEFYWRDLVGLKVYSELGVDDRDGTGDDPGEIPGEKTELLLGEVDHLLETGANDVLVLKGCPGSLDTRERLVPYITGSVIRVVEPEAGRILVRWHPDD